MIDKLIHKPSYPGQQENVWNMIAWSTTSKKKEEKSKFF